MIIGIKNRINNMNIFKDFLQIANTSFPHQFIKYIQDEDKLKWLCKEFNNTNTERLFIALMIYNYRKHIPKEIFDDMPSLIKSIYMMMNYQKVVNVTIENAAILLFVCDTFNCELKPAVMKSLIKLCFTEHKSLVKKAIIRYDDLTKDIECIPDKELIRKKIIISAFRAKLNVDKEFLPANEPLHLLFHNYLIDSPAYIYQACHNNWLNEEDIKYIFEYTTWFSMVYKYCKQNRNLIEALHLIKKIQGDG